MTNTDAAPPRAPRRVAVFRALKLGDMLCAVPALRAMRAAWPHARVVLVGLPWAAEFAARFGHLVDEFLEFPGWPSLPEREPDLEAVPGFLAAARAGRYDLAVQLHGTGPAVNELVALFGAARTAGFYRPGDWRPDPGGFVPWPEHGLEVRRLLRLTRHLGCPDAGEHLEFPLTARDFTRLAAAGAGGLRPGGYAVVHPGASVPERRWPAGHFAAAADALADRGLRVVLTGGTAERGLARRVAAAMRAEPLNLAGRTDLGATAALYADARLAVCNDTGVSHVAAAVRTPSVVVSTGDHPARWAPADARRHRVLCPAERVSVADVLREADDLLGPPPPPGRHSDGGDSSPAPLTALTR